MKEATAHLKRRARRRFRLVGVSGPLRDFFSAEVAGGAVLLVAALAGLVVAQTPLQSEYESVWSAEMGIDVGDLAIGHDLRGWINDGLMAVFFFVVTLEIKRELVAGELRSLRRAALPAFSALGGMLVPAGIFMAINASGDGFRGWGIPMATDIAFAVGLLALFSKHVPSALKTFLLTLAVVDDLGAIIVIAVFYSAGIELVALAAAAVLVAMAFGLFRRSVQSAWPYLAVGTFLWVALDQSGVHATIAGVILALLIPGQVGDDAPVLRDLTPSLLVRLEHNIHPYSSLLIVPVFALANTGISVSADELRDALGSDLVLGIVAGLVLGKVIGITLFAWLAIKSGAGHLHPSLQMRDILSAAAVAGIGFTVSLFIAELAFSDRETVEQAKIGILVASLLAAVVGSLLLITRGERP